MIFKIADFNIKISCIFELTTKFCRRYKSDEPELDCNIVSNEKDIIRERELSAGDNYDYTDEYLEQVSVVRKLAEWLPLHNAFILHSACFDIDGEGIAFAAHSGTGKTTHMNLWQKLLGDKMVIVNGDKPIVRFFDDEPETPYAYGTPWNGKEHLGCNMRTKLKHICFIERSETNYAQKMDKKDAVNLIFNQVYKPSDPMAIMKTMELIDRLLSCCNLWKIHCNLEDEAAEVAYNTIFSDKV